MTPPNPTRPLVDALDDVDEEEHVLRFVPWSAWQDSPPDGRSFLTPAFMATKEFAPTPDSYGPSGWIASKLDQAGGLAALELSDPRLMHKGIVKVPVREIRACAIQVKASPMDVPPIFAAQRDAHASFVGVDADKRNALLDCCQNYILRRPPGGSNKPTP